MNFFEHQEKARKQSRWIILAFLGVALLIVLAVDLLVLAVVGIAPQLTSVGAANAPSLFASLAHPEFWAANATTLLATSAGTGGLIGLASLGKIASLRGGGGKVARDMGATLVTPDTRDPLRRRLYNVVEEISLASGTPVPEVYVMENEPGINAFAAGYSPADAAVAVTQGTLEKLNRSELQGVIAHEFSHIFNGDMRINIRMMGVIFGIMVIALVGRKFLSASRYRVSSSRDNNGGGIIAIGAALMIVGYIGLFFARWMKSALSRQREYLADASAVQFTRDPLGISGALKKIAAYNHSSYLKNDAEEVSHMLFGSGYRSLMFATHPPLEKRIERLERGFSPHEIEQLAKTLQAQERREHIQAQKAEEEQARKKSGKTKKGFFDVQSMIDDIGNPDIERILAASVLAASIPESLNNSAHSLEWAPEVLFYCLLDKDERVRDRQLMAVVEEMGDISEKKLTHLYTTNGAPDPDQRLPLLEMSFPTLKRRPISDIEKILRTVDRMAAADNQVDSFEYLLSRLIRQYLRDAHVPNRAQVNGKKQLKDSVQQLSVVVSVLAAHGVDRQTAQGLQDAQKAFRSGMETAGIRHTNLTFNDSWQSELDGALDQLRKLTARDKEKLVQALSNTVLSDQKVVTSEQEMLRVICALVYVPLPIFHTLEQSTDKTTKKIPKKASAKKTK